MKQKISISIDENKVKEIEEILKSSRFRSKSHLIEYSLEKFLMEDEQFYLDKNKLKKQDEIGSFKNAN